MTENYTDCVSGTFYGFSNTSNFNIDQTVQIQWGDWDNGATKLNLYLTRPGGSLVQSLFMNAGFSPGNSIYNIFNSSSTCELDQVNVTIPSDIGVATNASETFQFGIFNSTISLGVDGNPLSGFLAWSPSFNVWNNVTSTAAATTSTTTSTSGTATSAPTQSTTTSTTAPDSSSGGLSSGAKAGIGIGVALGGILVAALIFGAWLWNRRKQRAMRSSEVAMESASNPPGPGTVAGSSEHNFGSEYETAQKNGVHEMPMGQQSDVKGYYHPVDQQPIVHEMPNNHQPYEMDG